MHRILDSLDSLDNFDRVAGLDIEFLGTITARAGSGGLAVSERSVGCLLATRLGGEAGAVAAAALLKLQEGRQNKTI